MRLFFFQSRFDLFLWRNKSRRVSEIRARLGQLFEFLLTKTKINRLAKIRWTGFCKVFFLSQRLMRFSGECGQISPLFITFISQLIKSHKLFQCNSNHSKQFNCNKFTPFFSAQFLINLHSSVLAEICKLIYCANKFFRKPFSIKTQFVVVNFSNCC